MRLLSADISTKKTGIAYFVDGNLMGYDLLDCSKMIDKEERMQAMAKKILFSISEWRPDIIVVEDTWNAVNVEASKMLTCLLGVTFGWAMSNCAEWHKMMPSSWRSYCGIKIGKKKRAELKQDSIDFVKDEFKIEVNDDVADAIGIGIGYINSVALKED